MGALKAAAEATGGIAVAGVPCNTFHAPPIWSRFTKGMQEAGVRGETVRVVHMLEDHHPEQGRCGHEMII